MVSPKWNIYHKGCGSRDFHILAVGSTRGVVVIHLTSVFNYLYSKSGILGKLTQISCTVDSLPESGDLFYRRKASVCRLVSKTAGANQGPQISSTAKSASVEALVSLKQKKQTTRGITTF